MRRYAATNRRRYSAPTPGRRRSLSPAIQQLENRLLLTNMITVENALDDGSTGSLRWAVLQADSASGPVTINFDPAVFNTPQTITLTAGPLNLTNTTGLQMISGPAAALTISGNGASQIFQVNSGVDANISQLTLASAMGTSGGAIYNAGNLIASDDTFMNNSATTGGAIDNIAINPGTGLAVTSCTFSGNFSSNGGAIYNLLSGQGNGVTVTSSTFTENTAAVNGGAIFAASESGAGPGNTLTIQSSTIRTNNAFQSGGGVDNANSGVVVEMQDTILNGNTASSGPDFLNAVQSLGNNFVSRANGSSGWVASDLTGTSANPLHADLGTLGYYGGPTETLPLLPGSPVIGAGVPIAGSTTDQRGLPIGSSVDIGAFQSQPTELVNSTSDAFSTTSGSLDLRQAVNLVNELDGVQTVNFDPAVFGTPQSITFTNGLLELGDTTGAVTINGPGADLLTISSNSALPVFQIDLQVNASLSNLTEANSDAQGAIFNDGTLALTDVTLAENSNGALANFGLATLTNCTLTGNSVGNNDGGAIFNGGTLVLTNATLSGNSGQEGGAIYNKGTATLSDCTLTNNFAGYGGAIANVGNLFVMGSSVVSNDAGANGGGLETVSGTLTLIEDTVASNTAGDNGGGLEAESSATVNILASTFHQNNAFFGGGGAIDNANSTVTVQDTILSGDSASSSPEFNDSVNSLGHNLVSKIDGSFGWVASDLTGTSANPLHADLGTLGYYGGPTETLPLTPGSPAIGAGIPIGGLTADQRGVPIGKLVDIGAFQSDLVIESASSTTNTTAAGLTLPGAVSLADTFAGENISFDPAIFGSTPQTITLTQGQLELSNTALATSISGPVNSTVIISGNNASQIFSIDPQVNASLSNLTLENANGGGAAGSAILNFGTLALTDATLTGDFGGAGGALYNSGSATLTNCLLNSNSANARGGAIFNVGTLNLTNAGLIGNSCYLLGGGALYNGGTATLTNCTIAGNVANFGDAIDNTGMLTVIGSNILSNLEGQGITSGSAIWNDGTLALTNATLTGNTGWFGGALHNSGTATLANCILASNVALYGGGAIDNDGTLTVTGSTFTGNYLSNNGFGGALLNSGRLSLDGTVFRSNSAYQGGAFSNSRSGLGTIVGCTFSGNRSVGVGGGIYVFGGSLIITDSSFLNNSAGRTGGGLIGVNLSTLTLIDDTFVGNVAGLYGGGLLVSADNAQVFACTFTGNSASSGGAIYNLKGTSTITVQDTILAGDSATIAPEINGNVTSLGNNLVSNADGSSGWVASDLTGTSANPIDAELGPLGFYGGPTETIPILLGSPALGAGAPIAGITTDQRGAPIGNFVDIGAFQSSLAVESTSGATDTTMAGLTLPGAVSLANSFAGEDITFDPAIFGVTPQTITLTQGLYQFLELSNTALSTSISGPVNTSLIVMGDDVRRILGIDSNVNVSISNLTLTDGNRGLGGAIWNYGTLTLTNATLTGNIAAEGGALFNGGTATLTNCTLTGNNAAYDNGYGGAIDNVGTLTVTGSTFAGNHAGGWGGALINKGRLSLSDSVFRSNSASYSGGAISNYSGAVAGFNSSRNAPGIGTISGCTFSGNKAAKNVGGGIAVFGGSLTITDSSILDNSSANDGGGLYDTFGTLTLIDDTIAGNVAGGNGGGVGASGNVQVLACTFDNNTASSGGAIDNHDGASTVTVQDSILAGDSAATAPEFNNGVTSLGNNLVSNATGSSGWVASDLTGTAANPLNALLGTLGNYGGDTETIPLLPGSPAIAAGAPIAGITTDQRGLAPVNPNQPDIGAFQSQGFAIAVLAGSPQVELVGGQFSEPLTVNVTANHAGDPVAGGLVTFSAPSSGASATLSSTTATIASNGSALVTATANSSAGSYNVQASASGANSSSFFLQNVNPLAVNSLASVTPNPRHTAVPSIQVTLSAPAGSFTETALTLTENGGSNLINSAVTVSLVSGSTYQINGLSGLTATNGEYTLTINAADIQDQYGNLGTGTLSTNWLMDTSPPASTVNPLPTRESTLTFPVSVTGTDGGNPASGIAYYTVYWSINGGPWNNSKVLMAPATSFNFTGLSNTSYSFYSIATDYAGNVENKAAGPEASTYVPNLTPPVTEVDGTTGSNPSTLNSSTGTFTLNLTGSDPGGGMLEYFEVYVSIDNGSYQQIGPYAIPAGPPDSSGNWHSTIVYQGLTDGNSHTYSFYSIGLDSNGNLQSAPSTPNVTFSNEVFSTPSALQVTGFTVEHGSPSRSFIQYFDVGFNESDSQSGGELTAIVNSITTSSPDIQIYQYNLNGTGNGSLVSLNNSSTSLDVLDHAIEINFGSGGILNSASSTSADGYYKVVIDLPKNQSSVHHFYRILGDVNGDQSVDEADLNEISASMNESGQIGWTPLSADVNGDGTVTSMDLTLAKRNKDKLGSGLQLG